MLGDNDDATLRNALDEYLHFNSDQYYEIRLPKVAAAIAWLDAMQQDDTPPETPQGEWTPLEDGTIDFDSKQGYFIRVNHNGSILTPFSGGYGVDVDLPPDIRLCRHTPQETWLDAPDGPGWWAFEGVFKQNDKGYFQYIFQVKLIDGELLAIVSDDYTQLSDLVGKWYRVHINWQQGE